jgi:CubicO group peptidase (beta-lactamase class C family)
MQERGSDKAMTKLNTKAVGDTCNRFDDETAHYNAKTGSMDRVTFVQKNWTYLRRLGSFLALGTSLIAAPAIAQTVAAQMRPPPNQDAIFAQLDADFASWMKTNNVPGLVWGVVSNGQLIHVGTKGVQDTDLNRPVTADTRFRIASMSKAFTAHSILQLRDAGKLRLDDPVTKHIPETRSWAQVITIADLLHHTAGFVTDDPWGDRQQPLPEADFTKMLKAGVPFSTSPGTRYEYSNFGYAMLGRIISNVTRRNFAQTIKARIFDPLGMANTTYEVGDVPDDRLARGYRWENDAWLAEPSMAHGAFGSMGGIVTSANDYAKWVAYLLKGQSGALGEVRARSALTDMKLGGGGLHPRRRPSKTPSECRLSAVYAMGLVSANDCTLGNVLFHGGGFPGYGSHMLLVPDHQLGVFALTNRTYAGPSPPVWDAATTLLQRGVVTAPTVPVSPMLANAYAAAGRIWGAGSIAGEKPMLAMNFEMDRTSENWAKQLATLKAAAGKCTSSAPVTATGALAGRFVWTCEKRSISGNILLAPTNTVQIQSLSFDLQ